MESRARPDMLFLAFDQKRTQASIGCGDLKLVKNNSFLYAYSMFGLQLPQHLTGR